MARAGPFGEGWGAQIEQAVPEGTITDAHSPIAVRCLVKLNNSREILVPSAWALAWTERQVLVMWRPADARWPVTIWLPAVRVRHRDSPVRDA